MSGIDGLAVAMVVAAVLVTPAHRMAGGGFARRPVALLAGVGVGICSSVIPYVTDQLAMVRLSRATYALMVALLPAIAVVVGVVVLGQLPSAAELVAVGLVIAGVAIHRDPGELEQTSTPEPLGAGVVGRVGLGRCLRGCRLRRGRRRGLGDGVRAGRSERAREQRQQRPLGARAPSPTRVVDRRRARTGLGQRQRRPRSAPGCTRSRRR